MKSIIILSTLLFVTASFMGIGSYIRYNSTLQEKGLYAPLQKEQTENTALTQKNESTLSAPNNSDMPENNEQADNHSVQQPVKKKTARHQSGQRINENVIHAARKPREREINFKEFSRAPLEDYPVAEITEGEKEAEEVGVEITEENK